MNIAVLGNSKFTLACFVVLKKKTKDKLILVSQKKKIQPKNSVNMKVYAKNNKINFFETLDINSDRTYSFLKSLNLDLIYSSWPKIISNKIINVPRIGIIGSHPTSLPKNKGRHPLHWLINLGCKNSHLSFFFMDETVDGGKIISRYKYQIKKNEKIDKLEKKIEKLASKGCYDVYKKVTKQNFIGIVQRKKNSNYLRKRNITDLIVNLKMNYLSIEKLVNSYTKPYDGAILIINFKIFRVLKIKKVFGDLSNVEIGRISKINQSSITTRCSDSLIKIFIKKLNKKDLNSISYIHDPTYYLIKSKSFNKKVNKLFKENQ